jgi:hypothetical protein
VSGNFIVVYEGYDAREECERASVRARPEEEEEAYKGAPGHLRAPRCRGAGRALPAAWPINK